MKTVIIIGGGASGMAAAASVSEEHRVILLEKNEKLGKKIYITGKGRCNLTNDREMTEHMKNVVSNPRFLYSAYNAFSKDDMKDLMEKNGCPVKTERGYRVFPVSDHASDVTRALYSVLKKRQVEVRLNTCVKSLLIEEGIFKGVITEKETILGDACIVATGGLSYPGTGSTGDGYRFAESAGHKIRETSPALVPLKAEGCDFNALSGLSLKNITASFYDPEKMKKPVYKEFGEMLFTHTGVSGPVILSGSSYVTGMIRKGVRPLLYLDLKPALSREELDLRIRKDFEKYINRGLKNALKDLLPSSLIPEVIKRSMIDEEKKVHEITREERSRLTEAFKAFRIDILDTEGYYQAVITQGGVNVKEINPSTMESKLVKGLYFAGEVLDVDAMTGGYNLQIAWSTGVLAGRSII